MRLKAIVLENFRGYQARTCVTVDQLTVFVGRNDAGKSTILEALEIFFKKDGKPDESDVCNAATERRVTIGCVFAVEGDQPLVLDSSAGTSLRREFLLNADGDLEAHKTWTFSADKMSSAIMLVAHHPAGDGVGDVIGLKREQLQKRVKAAALEGACKQNENPSMRQALWAHGDAAARCTIRELKVDGEVQPIWEAISRVLPDYVRFRSGACAPCRPGPPPSAPVDARWGQRL